MLGDGAIADGDRAAALDWYGKAVESYGEHLDSAPDNPLGLAYRGESRTLLAIWDPARREEMLGKARADFDVAAQNAEGDTTREVLLRRSAFHAAAGDVDAALADVEQALAGGLGMNDRFHATHARALLSVAARDLREGRPDAARRLDQAEEALGRIAVSSASAPNVLRMRGFVDLVRARLASDDAERDRRLVAAAKSLEESARHPMAFGVALAESELVRAEADLALARHAAVAAVADEREAEWAQGRWVLRRRYFDLLADALEAAGGGPDAAKARARARWLPD
jgi:hypothetical protein